MLWVMHQLPLTRIIKVLLMSVITYNAAHSSHIDWHMPQQSLCPTVVERVTTCQLRHLPVLGAANAAAGNTTQSNGFILHQSSATSIKASAFHTNSAKVGTLATPLY